jgi:hypothetical protein
MTTLHYENVRMHNIPNIVSIISMDFMHYATINPQKSGRARASTQPHINNLSGHVRGWAIKFGAWSFFLVHIRFTPSEGPKAFKTNSLRSWTMEVGS